jgi:hypothetical protein
MLASERPGRDRSPSGMLPSSAVSGDSARTIAVAIVLIALLLAPALPTVAKEPERTDFAATGYIGEMGPSAREWYTDDGAGGISGTCATRIP